MCTTSLEQFVVFLIDVTCLSVTIITNWWSGFRVTVRRAFLLAPLSLATLRAMELDLSDDALQESDYDAGSDSASHFLQPFVPLAVSPQKRRQRSRSIFSDRISSNRHYGPGVCFPLSTYASSRLESVLELW